MRALRQHHRGGLTVLELLVVTAIIGVLLALVLPAVQQVREAARNQQCLNQLRQLGVALHVYHDAFRSLPPGWRPDSSRVTAFGWTAAILPFLDQRNLYSAIDFRDSVTGPGNSGLGEQQLPVCECPSDFGQPSFALYAEGGPHDELHEASTEFLATLPRTSYVAIFGNSDPDHVPPTAGEGAFPGDRSVSFAALTRGLSSVALVGERTTRRLPASWLGMVLDGEDAAGRVTGNLFLGPNRSDADECELDSRHPGHINLLFADGHAVSVADAINSSVYRSFASRN